MPHVWLPNKPQHTRGGQRMKVVGGPQLSLLVQCAVFRITLRSQTCQEMHCSLSYTILFFLTYRLLHEGYLLHPTCHNLLPQCLIFPSVVLIMHSHETHLLINIVFSTYFWVKINKNQLLMGGKFWVYQILSIQTPKYKSKCPDLVYNFCKIIN